MATPPLLRPQSFGCFFLETGKKNMHKNKFIVKIEKSQINEIPCSNPINIYFAILKKWKKSNKNKKWNLNVIKKKI